MEYEESGWYDGQIWIKPIKLKEKESLIASLEVKPILKNLIQILSNYYYRCFNWNFKYSKTIISKMSTNFKNLYTSNNPPLEMILMRGSKLESIHKVHAVISDKKGRVLMCAGNPEYRSFIRSALKPFSSNSICE